MRNWIIAALVILSFSATTRPSDPPPHLAIAESIATEIKSQDNEYAHKECYVKWKGVDGEEKFANRTDCSDFFNLLIEHVYGFTLDQFKKWTGAKRPTAAVWYDSVSSGKAEILETIASLSDAAPGDMIFIKYQPGGEDTGHVMMIAGEAKRHLDSVPIVDGTEQWELPVIDSSKSGHGPKDTRHNADGTYSRGVGKGILRVYTNKDGTLAGYSWSVIKASKFVAISEHAMILARLKTEK